MKNRIAGFLFVLLAFCFTGHAQTRNTTLAKADIGDTEFGTASFYADKFQGKQTANGEIFDQQKFTCAHNSLPFNTWIKVTNLRNGRSVVVKVTDRLHHRNKRLVDLSSKAATKLGYIKRGLTRVKVEVLGKNKPMPDAGYQ